LSPTALRPLALCATVLLAACSGETPAPAPAGSPSPSPEAGGLQPLTSRDATPPGEMAGGGGGLPPGHPPIGSAGATEAPATAGASISGTITVASELQSRVASGDVLYVIAKKDGTTLAVQRVESPTFPFAFQLSKGHAMVPGTTLEGPVDIVARLSKTGDAIPSAGDLEGTTTGVAVPAEGVKVTISAVRQ
jgi:hypothetical protein